ncbi:hypothetical protein [Clostridium saccharoperbutylacetonicum]|uniref:glycan biosynthesis hexose transferase WsfD n=1 Tax=Clostridium saccharoperbutylacetonicum TaxID=36745 RepID=UPI000983B12D|nr:hypothetical protein [Clostridium saccharoperbutylacetonicum]AQR96042.1 hypothetical protein CLSAP_33600 [Clostridium saccharoperbutylacetonicum]NSB31910.1 hypothetical protein [Clostridium saccharoperbutylacetonicum]
MSIKDVKINMYRVYIILIAVMIITSVLFIGPEVGVADQGDFDRIMNISGLSLLDQDKNNPDFIRFFKYIVTEYKINPIYNFSKTIKGCSISYLIVPINKVIRMFGENIFKTKYLALIYSCLYTLALIIILKAFNIKNTLNSIIVSTLILLIFFDGNYLVWFNSLYGEPMMIVTLSLFIACVLNYIHCKYAIKNCKNITINIAFIIITAFLFLGSKLQVTISLPIIIALILKIIWDNRLCLSKISLGALCILIYILVLYPIGICNKSDNLCKDTEYNSVFYGVLNGSKTPRQDLIDLGLNPDMSIEAGKHSYLEKTEYEKYIPGAEITNEEFYSKVSNRSLAKFYLTHPIRLFEGMEYTAGKAFYTSTSLGKCSQYYSELPIVEFHRFTIWSDFRDHILPKNLYFIVAVYLIIIIHSIHDYINNKSNLEFKNRILLLWVVMLIGIIQFPMPFVGNGKADTAKQLFLFNFIFDGLLLCMFTYVYLKLKTFYKHKLQRK